MTYLAGFSLVMQSFVPTFLSKAYSRVFPGISTSIVTSIGLFSQPCSLCPTKTLNHDDRADSDNKSSDTTSEVHRPIMNSTGDDKKASESDSIKRLSEIVVFNGQNLEFSPTPAALTTTLPVWPGEVPADSYFRQNLRCEEIQEQYFWRLSKRRRLNEPNGEVRLVPGMKDQVEDLDIWTLSVLNRIALETVTDHDGIAKKDEEVLDLCERLSQLSM